MKTPVILVPTDFSDSSNNAAEYAWSLAKVMKASLILYHAYHIPVPTTGMPMMIVSSEQLDKENIERLHSYRAQLKKKFGNDITIDCITTAGFAVEEIAAVVKDKQIDFVIMGISGAGKISQALLGSVTTGVLNEVNVPLLIVPEGAKFSPLTKVGLAYDYQNEISPKILAELKTVTSLFKSQLFIIDVESPDEKGNITKAVSGIKLEQALENVEHTLHFPKNSDIVTGLIEFEENHKVDLLIMIPKRHSLISRIFNKSNTKRMAFHTHTPILALHE